MKLTRRDVSAALAALALPAPYAAATGSREKAPAADKIASPLVFYGAHMAVERAPVHMAMRNLYGDDAIILKGSSMDLIDPELRADLVGKLEGQFNLERGRVRADVVSNGETQMLRASAVDPSIRAIMTVAEGHYPIVARRSAGIASLADLKGKRILNFTRPATTSGFFLHKMLASVGLTEADVEIVHVSLGNIGQAVTSGAVDAIAIWEPDSEQAISALRAKGEDVVIFNGQGIFHERYNLATTTAALADPDKRRQIVALMREIIRVTQAINTDPDVRAEAQALVARSGGLYSVEEVIRGWPNVRFVANWDDGLLDLFVEEDAWLAPKEGRRLRSRNELARLIDRSLYEEATGRIAIGRDDG
ncbi:MAG: ABC transporter substrate-binding protein [Sphingobium sp.]